MVEITEEMVGKALGVLRSLSGFPDAYAMHAALESVAPLLSQAAEGWRPIDFTSVLLAAQRGLDDWRLKPHNARWWKRIDGTPIPNDLLVCVAEQIVRALKSPPAQPQGK